MLTFQLGRYHAGEPLVPDTHSLAMRVLVYFAMMELNEKVKYKLLGKRKIKLGF